MGLVLLFSNHFKFDGLFTEENLDSGDKFVTLSFVHANVLQQGKSSFKMKQLPFMAILCTVMLFIVYRTTNYQYHEVEVRAIRNLLDIVIYTLK